MMGHKDMPTLVSKFARHQDNIHPAVLVNAVLYQCVLYLFNVTTQMLISEIELKQSKVNECQKYAEQYSLAIKVYFLLLQPY